MEPIQLIKLAVGVLATVGLYSVLYKETKIYRFFEHMFLGLASGFTLVAVWVETLKGQWWDKMVGISPDPASGLVGQPGFWAYILLLPIGAMGYMVFSKKHNWMSRIPIGVILGFWAGQQVSIFWNRWGGQIYDSIKPIFPTSSGGFTVPDTSKLTAEQAGEIAKQVYPSQAISNLVFTITILCVLSYFFFSFDTKNKVILKMNTAGRWLLMVGLGAIFGSTVMARFALVIDRMFFIFIEFFRDALFRIGG